MHHRLIDISKIVPKIVCVTLQQPSDQFKVYLTFSKQYTGLALTAWKVVLGAFVICWCCFH